MTVTKDVKTPKLFAYYVKFYDEMLDEINEERGVTVGFTYAQAAEHIEDYYSTDNIVNLEIYETIILLSEDDLKENFEDS